jgi:hypothetical protein
MSAATNVSDPLGFIGKEFRMKGFDVGRVQIRVIGYDSNLRMYLTRPLASGTTGMRVGSIEALRMSPSMIQTRFQEILTN